MNKSLLLIPSLLFSAFQLEAATLPPLSLCDPTSGCLIGSQLFSSSNVEIYSAIDTSTFEQTVWARYSLGTASNYYYPYNPDYYDPVPPPLNIPLSGDVWIKTKAIYAANGSREATIFSQDRYGNDVALDFSMSDEALTGAYGYSYSAGGFGEVPWDQVIVAYENMTPLNLFTCVECGWDMELNLINMMYVDDGQGNLFFSVNASDTRQLIFSNETTYYIFDEYTYTLANVPVPSAAWLFASGLLILGSRRKSLR